MDPYRQQAQHQQLLQQMFQQQRPPQSQPQPPQQSQSQQHQQQHSLQHQQQSQQQHFSGNPSDPQDLSHNLPPPPQRNSSGLNYPSAPFPMQMHAAMPGMHSIRVFQHAMPDPDTELHPLLYAMQLVNKTSKDLLTDARSEYAERETQLKADYAAREAKLEAEFKEREANLRAEYAAREANLKTEYAAREAKLEARVAELSSAREADRRLVASLHHSLNVSSSVVVRAALERFAEEFRDRHQQQQPDKNGNFACATNVQHSSVTWLLAHFATCRVAANSVDVFGEELSQHLREQNIKLPSKGSLANAYSRLSDLIHKALPQKNNMYVIPQGLGQIDRRFVARFLRASGDHVLFMEPDGELRRPSTPELQTPDNSPPRGRAKQSAKGNQAK